jgi:hypothetical protein
MKGDSRWIFPSRRNNGKHVGRINSAHDRIVAVALNSPWLKSAIDAAQDWIQSV